MTEQAWLSSLSYREIAWLMLQLRDQSGAHSWFSAETAERRIAMYRDELRSRFSRARSAA